MNFLDSNVHLLSGIVGLAGTYDASAPGYHTLVVEYSYFHSEVGLQGTYSSDAFSTVLEGKTFFTQSPSLPGGPPMTAASVVIVPSGNQVNLILTHRPVFGAPCGPIKFSSRIVLKEGVLLPLPTFPLPPQVDLAVVGVGAPPSVNGISPLERSPIG